MNDQVVTSAILSEYRQRQRSAWESGQRVPIEQLLADRPELRDSAEGILDLIYAEICLREEHGESLTQEEYSQRFPQLSERIRKLFEVHEALRSQRIAGQSETDVRLASGSEATLAHYAGETPRDQSDASGDLSVRLGGTAQSSAARYRILRAHAKGGLGEVFVAKDGELHREVALKRIQSQHADNPDCRQRFLLEAEITGGLEHPSIVPVYGMGTDASGRPYYAMRFIRGDTLQDAIQQFHSTDAAIMGSGDRSLQFRKLLARFLDVCNAIEYAHSRGVIHRDLKPANIMLGKYGETLVVDWGLAKSLGMRDSQTTIDRSILRPVAAVGGELTQMGSMIGTPQYMSPEQAAGQVDQIGPRSDIYSLGATLYSLLTGGPPIFENPVQGVVELLAAVRRGAIRPPRHVKADVPKALNAICRKAMALRPEDRYATAHELSADIEKWLADEPVSAHVETPGERLARWFRRHRTTALTGTTAVVLIAIASTIAAMLVGQAEREKSRLQAVEAISHSFQARLDNADWSESTLAALDSLLAEWDRLDSSAADVGRERMVRSFTAFLEAAIQRPRLESAETANIAAGIARLESWSSSGAVKLRAMLARRENVWKPLVALHRPYSDLKDAFDADAIQATADDLRRVHPPGQAFVNLVTVHPHNRGNAQCEVIFAPDWEQAGDVGVLIDASAAQGYAFVLAAQAMQSTPRERRDSNDAPQFAARRAPDANYVAQIWRNGKRLRQQAIPATDLPPGPLRLWVKREGDRLTFQVGSRPAIEFIDTSPLRLADATISLDWPAEVGVRELHILNLKAAEDPSVLDQADQLLDAGETERAFVVYQEQAAVRRDSRLKQEARYKAAVCLMERKRFEEAANYLEAVVAEMGDRWPPLAGCQLWLCRLRQNRSTDADRVLDALLARFTAEQVASLVPDDVREQILDHYLGIFNTSHKFTRARLPSEAEVERTMAIDQLLSPDGRGNERAMYDLTIAHLMNDNVSRALDLAKRAAETYPTARALRMYSHVLRLAGKSQAALELIDRYLPKPVVGTGDFSDLPFELLIERARANVALARWTDVDADLDTIEAIVQDADAKQANVNNYHIARYGLLHGVMLDRRGDTLAARRVWKAAVERIRPEMRDWKLLDGNVQHFFIAAALSDSLADSDVAIVTEKLKQFIADYPGGNLLASQLNEALVGSAIRSMKHTRRGRMFAEAVAFDTPFDELQRAGWGAYICVMVTNYVCQEGLLGQPSREDEQLVWDAAKDIFARLRTGVWDSVQLGQFIRAWSGSVDELGWGNLAQGLEAPARARLACILARRMLALGRSDDAMKYFREAIQNADANSIVGSAARADMEMIAQGRARLVLESDFPESLLVELQSDGQLPRTLDVKDHQQELLSPGDYSIRIVRDNSGCQLSGAAFHLSAGEQKVLRINWMWRPNHGDMTLPGLLPYPARLPEVPRWQIEAKLTRGGLSALAISPDGSTIALAGIDGLIRMYDAKTRQLTGMIAGHSADIGALAFSPDGHWLASGCRHDQTARLWKMPSGQPGPVLRGHRIGVHSLAWTPDSKRLATGGYWADCEIRIWDVEGRCDVVIPGTQLVESLAWSPDGNWLAATGPNNTIRMWKPDGSAGPVLKEHSASVRKVSWSPDGKWLASGSDDRTARLWDGQNFTPGPVLKAHEYPVWALAWSPDGQKLAVGRGDGFMELYRAGEENPDWITP